ncbi:hypothetical protein WEI85_34905 [Actinomycetes bacterium KLBMP 9797]
MSVVDSADGYGAAVAAGAQQVAAFAHENQIEITPEQCEELAEVVIRFTEGFRAGARYAAEHPPTNPATDDL